jgi:hypothetical protein
MLLLVMWLELLSWRYSVNGFCVLFFFQTGCFSTGLIKQSCAKISVLVMGKCDMVSGEVRHFGGFFGKEGRYGCGRRSTGSHCCDDIALLPL